MGDPVVLCPACGARGHVPPGKDGRRLKCPRCHRRFMPGSSANDPALFNTLGSSAELDPVVEVCCPSCGAATHVQSSKVDTPAPCPFCHRLVLLTPVAGPERARKPRRGLLRRRLHPTATRGPGPWIAAGLVLAAVILILGWILYQEHVNRRAAQDAERMVTRGGTGTPAPEGSERAPAPDGEPASEPVPATPPTEPPAEEEPLDPAVAEARQREQAEKGARRQREQAEEAARREREAFRERQLDRMRELMAVEGERQQALLAAELSRRLEVARKKAEVVVEKRARAWLDARCRFECRDCGGRTVRSCSECGGSGWQEVVEVGPGGGVRRYICPPCKGDGKLDCGTCGPDGLSERGMRRAAENYGVAGLPLDKVKAVEAEVLGDDLTRATVRAEVWYRGARDRVAAESSEWELVGDRWRVTRILGAR